MRSTLFPVLLGLLLAACADTPRPPAVEPGKPQPDPTPGQTSFVSADAPVGTSFDDRDSGAQNNATPDDGGETPTVEEGDIYRVLADRSLVAAVNYYRGLQLIDFADPTSPTVVGDVRFSGEPVEMYQVGDYVYALVNDWYGYYGARAELLPTTYFGGSVAVVNIADEAAPALAQQQQVVGAIRTSRLVRGDAGQALYVVATDYAQTYVQSFAIGADGKLTAKSRIDLGGHVIDATATPTRLLVASTDYSTDGSEVAVIDISDPGGAMVLGDSVAVSGFVETQFNLDIRGDVLRVVSTSGWSDATRTNYVETFDASDVGDITPIATATFGDDQDLYATLFLEDRAFFVTYQRVDPFHAFEITADGQIIEHSEFIVSGWNDFFRSTFDDTRLVGVGIDDVNGWSLALSLYDITDLANPNPLITRESTSLQGSWSEANWDHRAFTVLEGATAVQAPDGTPETGLVLLPFSGWNETDGSYESGVQIFTFSDATITRRGEMDANSPVRRSFLADEDLACNLSDVELSLFATDDPDAPTALGRVELAPNHAGVMVFGDYAVRRHARADYYDWWGSRDANAPLDTLEVVALSGDVDRGAAVASVDVAPDAVLYQVGTSIVAVRTVWADPLPPDYKPRWHTELDVFDFSNPAQPAAVGTLTTDDLPPSWGWYYGPVDAGDDVEPGAPEPDVRGQYYPYYRVSDGVRAVGDALVFPEMIGEQELQGRVTVVWTYPAENWDWSDCWTEDGPAACTYYSGGIECRRLVRTDGTTELPVCSGAIYRCDQASNGDTECTEIDADSIETETSSWEDDLYRTWFHYDFHVVDVSDPANPTLRNTVTMEREDEVASLLVRGDELFVAYRRPFTVPGDPRPFVRWYFRAIDFGDPAAATLGAAVNVPGELLGVEGATLLTRDWLWGENVVETTVNRLTWGGSTATLEGSHRFADRWVQELKLDGAGHALVTHRATWWETGGVDDGGGVIVDPDTGTGTATRPLASPYDELVGLTILDLEADGLPAVADTEIDTWASLTDAIAGRALFTVPGGLLVVNLDDPADPYAQAYFAVRGWPSTILVEDRDVLMAAGRFGIYRFDLDAFNLLAP